jgi:PPOX class probable F420-dependent enzyme
VPRVPVSPEVDAFLAQPNPAVVGTLMRDGSPHTAATWYDWEDGRALLNMAASRLRLANIRRDPRASLTMMEEGNTYKQVTLLGRIVAIDEDPDLADIDRLSVRYTGRPHGDRARQSVSAWLEPERWYGWEGGSFWGH